MEIAVVKLMPIGEIIEKKNLVNPTIQIPAESTAIHHISNEDVKTSQHLKSSQRSMPSFLKVPISVASIF